MYIPRWFFSKVVSTSIELNKYYKTINKLLLTFKQMVCIQSKFKMSEKCIQTHTYTHMHTYTIEQVIAIDTQVVHEV